MSKKRKIIPNVLSFATRILLISLLLTTLLTIFPSNQGYAQSPGPCGDTYIVLRGDTLEGIAQLCGTTVDAILEINPEIYDPENLYVGQIIRIPYIEVTSVPHLAISPTCGRPGTTLKVVGSGYPPGQTVQISLGPKGQKLIVIGNITSDEVGRIETSVVIPSSANIVGQWVVVGEALISTAVFRAISNIFSLIGASIDPNASFVYQAQSGDSLESIAIKFNRNEGEIQAANPNIPASGEIQTDSTVQIPAVPSNNPVTTLSPYCGPADTTVQVNGSDFPLGELINLSTGIFPISYTNIGTVQVYSARSFTTSAQIPDAARPGEQWVVLANTAQEPIIHSTSNVFRVTIPIDPKADQLYIVQSGDSLNEIASTYKRTVASIMEANPQITNPNQVPIGEVLIIPGQEETLLVSPIGGPPGTNVQVAGVGFTPTLILTLGFGQKGKSFAQTQTITVDTAGNIRTAFTFPSSVLPGEIWTVTAVQTIPSGTRVLAVSNEFTVTQPQAAYQPYLSIWPLNGIAGTRLYIVGANLPPKAQITVSMALQGSSPIQSMTTWSDINGSFALYSRIPITAEPGEIWTITAKTVKDPIVEATSPIYTVTGPGVVLIDQVDIYLIIPGTSQTGCSIEVAPISQKVQSTTATLYASINELLNFKLKNDPTTGYYNALYLSNLEIESIQINNQDATIQLTGQLKLNDSCDYSQILAQLNSTILQYPEITKADILINGKPIEEYDPNK